MSALDIVNQFYAVANYDPDSRKFQISDEYILTSACKQMDKLFKDFEDDGGIAAIYAKDAFFSFANRARVRIMEALTKPDGMKELADMYAAFTSPEMLAIEDAFLDALHQLACKLSGKPMLGKRDRETELKTAVQAVAAVVEKIGSLRVECYKRGGRLSDNLAVLASSRISVFPTLAQCVLAVEQAGDGLYLCYIRNGDTADGYFGLFLKDNGNVLSFNERPDEAFIGQHKHSRNAYWTESKAYELFPYGSFDFGKHDYKGYATAVKIDESQLSFADMPTENYFPTILAILLLSRRYGGQEDVGEDVFIDSLLPANLQNLEEKAKSTKALIPIEPGNSAIVTRAGSLDIAFSNEDVLAAKSNKDFDYDPKNPFVEHGTFPEQTPDSYAQMLIDLYGEGFQLDKTALLRSDCVCRMLPADGNEGDGYNVEFVGSERRMQIEAYRQARAQLAEYIEQRMFEEYKAFGGCNAVTAWWKSTMLERKEAIEKMCVDLYRKNDIAGESAPEDVTAQGWSIAIGEDEDVNILCYPDTDGKRPEAGFWKRRVSIPNMIFQEHEKKLDAWDRLYETGQVLCPITGNKPSIYFQFDPRNWKGIEKLAACEVPKIVKGWDPNVSRGAGNPLLDATDAVWQVKTPLEAAECSWEKYKPYFRLNMGHYVDFSIAIGWSKRGWAKMLKKYPAGE